MGGWVGGWDVPSDVAVEGDLEDVVDFLLVLGQGRGVDV